MKVVLPLLLSLTANVAFANLDKGINVYSDQFQQIRSVELQELVLNSEGFEVAKTVSIEMVKPVEKLISSLTPLTSTKMLAAGGGVLLRTREFIALGKAIYKIVEAGRPVTNINSAPIEILPNSEKGNAISAMDLDNWRGPSVKKFRVNVKNYLGFSPAHFDFIVLFNHSGSYNGSGKYITGAQIKPTDVMVRWGYSLDATFKVQSITNRGPKSSPVASAILEIDYTIGTVLQTNTSSKLFFISGDGSLKGL